MEFRDFARDLIERIQWSVESNELAPKQDVGGVTIPFVFQECEPYVLAADQIIPGITLECVEPYTLSEQSDHVGQACRVSEGLFVACHNGTKVLKHAVFRFVNAPRAAKLYATREGYVGGERVY